MKYCLFLLIFSAAVFQVNAQTVDEMQVRDLLAKQVAAWNEGNIESYMHGYWNNDSLMFIGKTGITYGYAATLENYTKGYPGKEAMGRLAFDVLEIKRLSVLYYFVVGKWSLQRSAGNISGSSTLLLKKIKGKWLIIADHSS